MARQQGLRLGLFARMGFIGMVVVGAIAGFASIDWQRAGALNVGPAQAAEKKTARSMPADQADATAQAGAKAGGTIEDLLAGDGVAKGAKPPKAADITGSISPTAVAKPSVGAVSGLPIPRFVSVKADKVNVRRGPSRDHDIAWIFQRSGLPVEITAEFETWRRIRDSDGTEGWVMHSMLSGRRTALVAPWSKGTTVDLHASDEEDSAVVAKLEPGVTAQIKECTGEWCRLDGDGFRGWVRQSDVWGAYPGEKVD
jgi:SH3-like domain-containing protein